MKSQPMRAALRRNAILFILIALVVLLLAFTDLAHAAPSQECGYLTITGTVRYVACNFLRCAGTIYEPGSNGTNYFVRSPLWTQWRERQTVTATVRHCW